MKKFQVSWRTATLSALFGGVMLGSVNLYAAKPDSENLFSSMQETYAMKVPERAIKGKTRAVKVHREHLKRGRFQLNLPGDISFEAVRELQQDMGGNRFAWVGHAKNDRSSRVIVGVSGNAVAGSFAYKGKLYKLEPRANGEHVISEVEPGDPAPGADPIAVADDSEIAAELSGTAAAATADGGVVIDVLVAYTPKVKSVYGTAGAEALIIQAVAETNQAYTKSGINPRLNLVKTVLTSYTESGSMNTDLSRLRAPSDGHMDELHTLRNTYGADLVTLIEHQPQYCGLAYRMTKLSSGFASSAFSVIHRTCATGYYSFAHELGHNQGAHHDLANAGGAIYPYAYGHQDPFGSFRTVMAYNCNGGCTRVDHFSNPDVLYKGKPTGAFDAADNALTLNNTAATIANFRQRTTATPPAAPSNLVANATSHSTIDLSWKDNATDESGFRLERSTDGVVFSEIATLGANSRSYGDDNLLPDTLYTYRIKSWNSTGHSYYSSLAIAATALAPTAADQLANADIKVAGYITGTYQRTWEDDGTPQVIKERRSGGIWKYRHGYLEHKWTFDAPSGNSPVLLADAATTTSADSFVFSYSTDDLTYTDMFTITAGSPTAQQFALPPALSGTIYIRVRDTVRNPGERSAHKLKVDYLSIRSES